MKYGYITFNIEKILQEKEISKNQICKQLDIPRTNFNRYCQNKVTRYDETFICKLCYELNVSIGELMEYHQPEKKD